MVLSTMMHTTIEVKESHDTLPRASIVVCNTIEYSKAGIILLQCE